MRSAILVLLTAALTAMAAPSVEAADATLEARGYGCVYGNNQCPEKCRAGRKVNCDNSYCVTTNGTPYGSCLCKCK